VTIKFSRHAKRRGKLYGIPEAIIVNILNGVNLRQGENVVIKDIVGFKYPLKIVVSVEKDITTVITNYPLKKGRKK
jgi:hypothetical protein